MNNEKVNEKILYITNIKMKIEEDINNLIKNKKNIKKYKYLYNKLNKINDILFNLKKIKNINKEIDSIKKIENDIEFKSLVEDELKILYNNKNNTVNLLNSLINNLNNENTGCFIEIRSGTGGTESSLFINILYKMYLKYSYKKLWNINLISRTSNNQGGLKEVILKINNEFSYNYLKFESGGHRVQRIPETESKGRIHTSTCIVAVIPIIPEKKFKDIKSSDLKIDSFKSSGAGGQHVNTTDSAIRITHLPTGLVIECQDERSQHKNKSKAISILQSRLYIIEKEKEKKKKNIIRKNLLGTGYRTDRIRTYNFTQNRVTDHRISFSTNKLNEIINGNLDILINNIIKK